MGSLVLFVAGEFSEGAAIKIFKVQDEAEIFGGAFLIAASVINASPSSLQWPGGEQSSGVQVPPCAAYKLFEENRME